MCLAPSILLSLSVSSASSSFVHRFSMARVACIVDQLSAWLQVRFERPLLGLVVTVLLCFVAIWSFSHSSPSMLPTFRSLTATLLSRSTAAPSSLLSSPLFFHRRFRSSVRPSVGLTSERTCRLSLSLPLQRGSHHYRLPLPPRWLSVAISTSRWPAWPHAQFEWQRVGWGGCSLNIGYPGVGAHIYLL